MRTTKLSTDLIGSPAQNQWARQIRADFLKMAGGDVSLLPTIESSRFWIDSRNSTSLLDLHEAAAAFLEGYLFASPFTSMYPKLGRSEAVLTLQSLDRFMVMDLETDGVGKPAQILEIGIVDQQGKPLLSSLVRPPDMTRLESKASEKARESNGITAAMVEHAPTLSDLWEDIVEVITEPQNGILTTYNASFDVPVLRTCGQREGLLVPTFTAICVMRLATSFFERDFYCSLDEAGALAGVNRLPDGTAHRATDDAAYTAWLIQQLRHLAKEE